jgi:hypothetical protein
VIREIASTSNLGAVRALLKRSGLLEASMLIAGAAGAMAPQSATVKAWTSYRD